MTYTLPEPTLVQRRPTRSEVQPEMTAPSSSPIAAMIATRRMKRFPPRSASRKNSTASGYPRLRSRCRAWVSFQVSIEARIARRCHRKMLSPQICAGASGDATDTATAWVAGVVGRDVWTR